jgi:OPA family glycerol-3-phosphate transporter-like MFS transporter
VNAGAYFCTGFVRRSLEAWWVLFLLEVWSQDKRSSYYLALVWLLPVTAFVGSLSSGIISDALLRGRRSPVAAMLYGVETLCILCALWWLGSADRGTPLVACVFLALISSTCNSSHSIIGSAAVMDLGGRQMSGFACGVIDSFQYFGAILAGFLLGRLIDAYGWNALFASMLPFSLLGTVLMAGLWLRTRGREVRGA